MLSFCDTYVLRCTSLPCMPSAKSKVPRHQLCIRSRNALLLKTRLHGIHSYSTKSMRKCRIDCVCSRRRMVHFMGGRSTSMAKSSQKFAQQIEHQGGWFVRFLERSWDTRDLNGRVVELFNNNDDEEYRAVNVVLGSDETCAFRYGR